MINFFGLFHFDYQKYSHIGYNILNMSSNYDSTSESLLPFVAFTAFMKQSSDEQAMPTITTSVGTNSFNASLATASVFFQTSSSGFNPPTYFSTTPVLDNDVTSGIKSIQTSTLGIIKSNFNFDSGVPYLLPTIFLEGFIDTSSTLLSFPQSTVMPTPRTLSPNSGRYSGSYDTGNNTREYIFPAIEIENLRFSLWQDTLQGVSYLYHVNSSEIAYQSQ